MLQAFRALPTQEEIRQSYLYEPDTGNFIYTKTYRKGKIAGHKRTRRGDKPWLILINVNGVQYPAHRLAWMYMTGEDPALTIDHIDQNPFNNAWSNLRLADHYLQADNRTYKSDYPGVNFHKASGKWAARIQRKGKRVHLGLFNTKKEAIVCRAAAVQDYETD